MFKPSWRRKSGSRSWLLGTSASSFRREVKGSRPHRLAFRGGLTPVHGSIRSSPSCYLVYVPTAGLRIDRSLEQGMLLLARLMHRIERIQIHTPKMRQSTKGSGRVRSPRLLGNNFACQGMVHAASSILRWRHPLYVTTTSVSKPKNEAVWGTLYLYASD